MAITASEQNSVTENAKLKLKINLKTIMIYNYVRCIIEYLYLEMVKHTLLHIWSTEITIKIRRFDIVVRILSISACLYLLSRLHLKFIAIGPMIHGRYRPCDSNTKKNIYSITSGHISNTSISIFILYGSYFTCKCIWNKEMNNSSFTMNKLIQKAFIE